MSRPSALNVGASKRTDSQQWVANYGHFLSDTTHYTVARLAQTTVSMTARASFTVTPLLTFQFYAQPFMSAGTFSDWREIGEARAEEYDDRFESYGGGAAPDGFNVKQFNSNAVVRWASRGRFGAEFAAPVDPLSVLTALGGRQAS